MFQNKAILQNVSWQPLIVALTILLTIDLYLLLKLFEVFNTFQLGALVLLTGGVVSLIGGYILTKRSYYEVFPTTRQIFGALLNGLLLFGMIILFLLLLSSVSVAIVLYLFVILVVIEFLVLRIFQGKRLNVNHVLGIVLTGVTVYIAGQTFPAGTEYIYLFIGLAVLKELLGRATHTYLLSPWVNSIWNGAAIFVSTLVALPFVANIEPYREVGAVLSLPLWVGLVVLFLSASVILLLLFKRKIVVAKGYMQYKLQAWTLAVMVASLFVAGSDLKALAIGFVLIIISYAVIEGRVFVKE